jgi:hypothetical protein
VSVAKILSGEANTGGVAASDASQCQTDTFTVSPSTTVPVLCGTLTGEHSNFFYVKKIHKSNLVNMKNIKY